MSAKNPDILGNVAGKVADAITKVPGIEPASVNNGVVPAGDALDIHVDPALAAMVGGGRATPSLSTPTRRAGTDPESFAAEKG